MGCSFSASNGTTSEISENVKTVQLNNNLSSKSITMHSVSSSCNPFLLFKFVKLI